MFKNTLDNTSIHKLTGFDLRLKKLSHATRFEKWVRKRIPASKIITLGQRNIFIMPTWAGLGFGFFLLLLLLTAINYQSSLMYLLTFFMGGLFFISILFCFSNLEGLSLAFLYGESAFVGESVRFIFKLSAPENKRYQRLFISNELDSYQWVDIDKGADATISLFSKSNKRGRIKPGRILLETRFPMGFLRAWSWLDLQAFAWVYPEPIKGESFNRNESNDNSDDRVMTGIDDFSGIREYEQGDPTHRIAWKQFASKGELYIKTFESTQANTQWVDYDAFQGVPLELRLSHLCFELLENEKKGNIYGLKLPGRTININQGNDHLSRCLLALAAFSAN
jgi:uncharacterized protein (DUF58 family)